MIDIHAHILPGMDDGPEEMGTALAMAKKAVASGTRIMIATPHFLNNKYLMDRASIEQAVDEFNRQLKQKNIGLTVFAGAEIPLVYNTCALLDKGELPSLADSSYYLFELPEIFITDAVLMVLRQLRERGVIPVIAHPERNYTLMKHPGLLADFQQEGAVFQITGQSIIGDNGQVSRKMARSMIKEDRAKFIASDGHDPKYRPTELKRAVKAVTGMSCKETARKLVWDNPAKIINEAPGGRAVKRVG